MIRPVSWLVVPVPTVAEFAGQAAAFAAARVAAGLPPSPHGCRLLEVVCAPDEETAVRRAAPFLLAKYAAYQSWGIPGLTLDPQAAPEVQFRRLAADRFAVGSPAQVVEALLAQHRAGVTHATMRVSWPGMRQDDVLAGIELLGRSVLPEVRRATLTDGQRGMGNPREENPGKDAREGQGETRAEAHRQNR